VELADRIEWRLCKKMLRIHSSVANRASDSELGTQSRTAKILSFPPPDAGLRSSRAGRRKQ
jgi:hypothetical protein